MMKLSQLTVGACLLVYAVAGVSQAASVYSLGHGDFRPSYDGSVLDLFFEGDASTVIDGVALGSGLPAEDYIFDSTELLTVVPNNATSAVVLPFDIPEVDYVTGEQIWILSEVNQQTEQPFLGFSGESLPNGVFAGAVEFELIGFNGPGHFALLQSGIFGGLNFFAKTIDGLSSADTLSVFVGSHAHYSWLFSEPGTYELTWQASATLSTGGEVTSAPETFTFQVIPEPASMVSLALGLLLIKRR